MLGNLDLNYAKGQWHFTVNERKTGMMNVINTSGGPGCGGGTPVCSNIQENSPGYWATNLLLDYDLPRTTWYRKPQLFFNAFNFLNTNCQNPPVL